MVVVLCVCVCVCVSVSLSVTTYRQLYVRIDRIRYSRVISIGSKVMASFAYQESVRH